MFLAEPPPSQGDLHFSLLGFPVRINPWFWLTTVVLGLRDPDPVALLLWVAAVLLCILLHELGHALVMRAYGFDAAIVLYSFGGLAIPRPGRRGMRNPGPWGQILICAAGPASGFILTGLLVLGLHYLGRYPIHFPEDFRQGNWLSIVPEVDNIRNSLLNQFLKDIFWITIFWGILNLLPIFPLDGGQIAQQFFSLFHPQEAMRQSLILSVIVAGMMCYVAFVRVGDMFLGIFFLWLAYSSFSALQSSRVT